MEALDDVARASRPWVWGGMGVPPIFWPASGELCINIYIWRPARVHGRDAHVTFPTTGGNARGTTIVARF